ncbi:MAG TPA: septal ring lytic transglycosylase RlpA family protein [Gammaproteobacteria bacterium]|nr:septal ring lytic transglycosylase RlpA family protein [Gammaproteobacteria bacterium]
MICETIFRRPLGRLSALLCLSAVLSACSTPFAPQDGPPANPIDVSDIPNAVPRVEPRSRYGNPSSYVVNGHRYHVLKSSKGFVQRGIASWYGTKFAGKRTSSGEPYNMYAMTAAHKRLPLPTFVQVTNLRNGRKVIVRVNDRGPFHPDRIIDLSYAAAAKLGMLGKGTAPVVIRAINPHKPTPPTVVARKSDPPQARASHARSANLFLQVGAFVDRRNAERLRGRLRHASVPGIHITRGYHDRRPIYRVQVGPLQTVEQADRMAHTLSEYGVHDAQVVVD